MSRFSEHMGGGREQTITVDLQLRNGDKRVQTVWASGTGLAVKMPDATTLRLGGPHFYVLNIGDVNSFDIEDASGALLVSAVAINKTAILTLRGNSTVSGDWVFSEWDISGSATAPPWFGFNNATIDAFAASLVSIFRMEDTTSPLVDDVGGNDAPEIGSVAVYQQVGLGFGGKCVKLGSPGSTGWNAGDTQQWVPDDGVGDFTLDIWFNHNGGTFTADEIIGIFSDSLNILEITLLSTGFVRMRLVGGGATVIDSNNNDYNDDEWHLVVIRQERQDPLSDTRVRMWLDGNREMHELNISGLAKGFLDRPDYINAELLIGAIQLAGDGHSSEFIIDECSVWNTALSEAAIVALFNEGVGEFHSGVVS